MNAEQLTVLIAKPYRTVAQFGYDFPFGLLFGWISSGPDAQLEYDLETDSGADAWTHWWIAGGKQRFPAISNEIDRILLQTLHLDHLGNLSSSDRVAVTPLLSLICRHRKDVQRQIDMDRPGGIERLWYWWLRYGRREYFDLQTWLITAEVQAIHCVDVPAFAAAGIPPLTAAVRLAAAGRDSPRTNNDARTVAEIAARWTEFLSSDAKEFRLPNLGLPAVPGLKAPAMRHAVQPLCPPYLAIFAMGRPDLRALLAAGQSGPSDLVYWWLVSDRTDFPAMKEEIDQDLVQWLHVNHLPDQDSENGSVLTPLLTIIRDHRPDLQQLFDGASDGPSELRRWWQANGRHEYFPQSEWLARAEARRPHSPGITVIEEKTATLPVEAPSSAASNPRVSLIGYPKGEFGLGEDARLLRAALDQAGIGNVVINAPWEITARQSIEEPSVNAAVADFNCDVMFYVMPPFDTVTLLNQVGLRAFSAKRRIGFWQWELDRFPIAACPAMNLVDEIWCHSEHSAKAFRAATSKPVIKVPLPVFVPEPRSVPREDFGLPVDAFMVFTGYDGASAIARKNPLAAIVSFQQAFPRNGEINACLIVKAMNTRNDSLWRECLRKASVDKRIKIIDDVLDRDVYYEILKNSDAVLSLHRAEGFGRLMAEAMALGIPVIASGYSGNLDFMTDQNSWLIGGDLISLFPGDYPFHHNQQWLEPNTAEAAQALRECATNLTERHRRAELGKETVTAKYNLATCGKAYADLLSLGTSIIPAGAK